MNSEIIIIIFYVVILFTVACEKKGQEIPFNELSETPTLLLNPNGNTPLAAELSLETRVPVKVSFTVKGEEDFTRSVDNYQTSHKVPIVGLYPSRNNELVITLTDKKDNWATISLFVETDSLPSFFPEVDIEVAKYDQMQEGWTLCEFSLATNTAYLTYPFVVDKQGVVRWFMSVADFNDIVFPFQIKKNGNFLFGHASEIYETDWLGYDINSWAISGFRQDHDIYEKPNGNLLITGNNTAVATVADHIFELNPYGDIVNTWDMRQVLDISRTDLVNDANDWLHLNAVWYSENDDCIVVSGRNQGLMKLTNGGELKWILAPHKGWEMAGVNGSGLDTRDFLLTAVDANGVPYNDQIQQGLMATDDFDWTWGQHAVMVLPNDEVFVFDNGFKRNFLNATTTHSRAVAFKINEDNKTVQQVWQYGKERGYEVYAPVISDVDYLENSNRIMAPGMIFLLGDFQSKVIEVTYPNKEVVFEMTLHYKNEFSSAGFGWGDFDLSYRCERIKMN